MKGAQIKCWLPTGSWMNIVKIDWENEIMQKVVVTYAANK